MLLLGIGNSVVGSENGVAAVIYKSDTAERLLYNLVVASGDSIIRAVPRYSSSALYRMS